MVEPAARLIDRVDVGIVVAVALEASAIAERLTDTVSLRAAGRPLHVGRLGRSSVAVVASGVGKEAALRGTRLLLEGHRPGRIIAAGLCGGLDPAIPHASVVVADRVGLLSQDHGLPPATRPVTSLPDGWADRMTRRPVRGTLVTSGSVVDTAAAKRRLHEATGAVAVDMESWWVVDEAGRAGIPAHVVRGVCDTATENVPRDVASLGEAPTTARMAGAALRILWQRPSAAIDLVELRERALAAADTVASHLEAMIAGG